MDELIAQLAMEIALQSPQTITEDILDRLEGILNEAREKHGYRALAVQNPIGYLKRGNPRKFSHKKGVKG